MVRFRVMEDNDVARMLKHGSITVIIVVMHN